MKKILFISFIAIIFISCNSKDKFKISGIIQNADSVTLYLEHTGLDKTDIIDSLKPGKSGNYSFKSKRPLYPDFYRLRIGDQFIVLAIDSCEKITVNANANNFSMDYTVEGSQTNVDIQKLRKSVSGIQRKVNLITPQMTSTEQSEKIAEIEKDIENHKEMARKIILKDPHSPSAYFAIFQQINNSYLFSPYITTDKPYCAAVATSYNAYMPDYIRTKNLYNLVMDAIKTARKEKQNAAWKEIIANSAKGYIDINLNDRNNTEKKLSDLEGQVILIDFSAYESEQSVQYTFELRDLYNKYHGKGFEIYQISLDRNKLLWEESTSNIPWICVRDEKGPETQYVNTYNISEIPTTFLMNRKGVIIGRSFDFKSLDKEIQKLL